MFCTFIIMGPSFLEGGLIMCWSCPSVCLSVPCLHLEGKRKGLRIPNLVGRVPGTPALRGPISRSSGQRSRSRQLIALLAKNLHNFAACCPINLIFGRWRSLAALHWVTSLPWQRPFRPSVRPFVRRVSPPRAKTKWPRKTELDRKGPWDTSTPWTNFKVKALTQLQGRPHSGRPLNGRILLLYIGLIPI